MRPHIIYTIIFLAILVCLMFSIGTTKEVVSVAFSFLIFSLPGLPIYKASFRLNIRRNPEALFLGAVFGISLSCFVAVMVGYFVQWNVYTIAGSLAICWGILHILQKKLISTDDVQITWERNDYSFLLVLLSIVLLSIAYPFLNVGRLTDSGFAFAHLFGHDFIIRVSVAASIAHGIPPDYLHSTGTILPTYWLFYSFPAFVYLVLGPSSSLQNIMLLTEVFYAMLFTAILFCVLKTILKKRISVILSMLICLFAYSYYDIYVLFQYIVHRLPEQYLSMINRLGVSDFSGISHSIFRLFLFEPQAILALSLILVIIMLFRKDTSGSSDQIRYPLIGLLMALSMGIDAFIGIIIVIWCTVALASDLFEEGRVNFKKILPLIEAIFVFLFVFLGYYFVQMYTTSSGNSGILFKPYTKILVMLPVYYILEFGPTFVFGVLGAIILKKQPDKSQYTPVLLLGCITLFISLCIRHHIEINVGLRKGGYVFYIPLIIFCGIFFDYIFSKPLLTKRTIAIVTMVLVFAIPTLFTDINVVSNIADQKKTTYVSAADYNACQWIKNNTPTNSVVQSEPEYPSPYEYSLVPCFAERAMVVSESKCSLFVRNPNIRNIAEEKKQEIRSVFSGKEIRPTLDTIKKYGINFIYFGPYEQKLYATGAEKFDKYREYFEKVYSVDGVKIYKISSKCYKSVL